MPRIQVKSTKSKKGYKEYSIPTQLHNARGGIAWSEWEVKNRYRDKLPVKLFDKSGKLIEGSRAGLLYDSKGRPANSFDLAERVSKAEIEREIHFLGNKQKRVGWVTRPMKGASEVLKKLSEMRYMLEVPVKIPSKIDLLKPNSVLIQDHLIRGDQVRTNQVFIGSTLAYEMMTIAFRNNFILEGYMKGKLRFRKNTPKDALKARDIHEAVEKFVLDELKAEAQSRKNAFDESKAHTLKHAKTSDIIYARR